MDKKSCNSDGKKTPTPNKGVQPIVPPHRINRQRDLQQQQHQQQQRQQQQPETVSDRIRQQHRPNLALSTGNSKSSSTNARKRSDS